MSSGEYLVGGKIMIALMGLATRLQVESVKETYEIIEKNLRGIYQRNYGIVADGGALEEIIANLEHYEILIIAVLTGGTRKLIVRLGQLQKITVLISNTKQNALASALHALYIVSKINKKIWHIHGEPSKLPWDLIRRVILGVKELVAMRGNKIVLMGVPKQYLDDEGYDINNLRRKLGISIETISLNEFIVAVEKAEPDKNILNKIASMRREHVKGDDTERKIAKIYSATISLLGNSIGGGIRCFPIISKLGVTPCLVVSDLLDKDKIFVCEADLAIAVTMLFARKITGEMPFVANPVAIDEKNRMILAHCTAATKLFISEAKIVSHFETGLGYAVQGDFRENQVVTLLKIDPSFSKMFITRGRIVRGKKFSDEFCRNQLVVQLSRTPISFLTGEFAHHLAVIYGDHVEEVEFAAKLLGFGVVYE